MNPNALADAVAVALKEVRYPGYSRDIVSFGLVEGVRTQDGVVSVALRLDNVKRDDAFRIQADVRSALKALPLLTGLGVEVEVGGVRGPEAHPIGGREPLLTPLQDELRGEGGAFDRDPMVDAMARPDLAPEAGYGEEGPSSLDGPMGDSSSMKWQGPVPVFQWEIDPSDPQRQGYGEHETERGGWVFRVWWQTHPAGLVYASVSAIADADDELRPFARAHPVGRNIAVNLVYDLRRQGVLAVYGTALDFRPFVEVFLEGFGAGEARGGRSGEATNFPASTATPNRNSPAPGSTNHAKTS